MRESEMTHIKYVIISHIIISEIKRDKYFNSLNNLSEYY